MPCATSFWFNGIDQQVSSPTHQQGAAQRQVLTQSALFWQVFIEANAGSEGDDLERELFIIRKLIEKEKAARMGDDAADFYIASLSDKTIVYKVRCCVQRRARRC